AAVVRSLLSSLPPVRNRISPSRGRAGRVQWRQAPAGGATGGFCMRFGGLTVLAVALGGCGQGGSAPRALSADDAAFQKKLQEQLLDAKPGTIIEIPAGTHRLDRVLTLRANGVTLRGAGADKSILSFKDEISGPEGMLVYASDFTLEHVAIE